MTEGIMSSGRRGSWRTLAAAAVVLAVIGVLGVIVGVHGNAGPPQPDVAPQVRLAGRPTASNLTPSGSTATAPAPTDPQPQFGQTLAASRPTGLEIPAIGLKSTNFVDLALAADGTATAPGSANEVGFYAPGPTPGEIGPAVFGAHVDSKQGPGVFYRLGAVKPGNQVIIRRQDGSTITFTVDKVASYPKDQFPTDEVYYGSFTQSEIRLVTCGGPFDRVKHYLDNIIVFGHLTSIA